MAKTNDTSKIIDRMVGQDKAMRDLIAEEAINVRVARMIHDARTKAGLTQKDLAKLVGTTQSVIARLEDADYEGHSLNMLNRIADALRRPKTPHMKRGSDSQTDSWSVDWSDSDVFSIIVGIFPSAWQKFEFGGEPTRLSQPPCRAPV